MKALETLHIESVRGRSVAINHYRTGHAAVVILVHGFFNNKDTLIFKDLAGRFSARYDVISMDMRGHGKTGGVFTWTVDEPTDLDAVVAYAKKCRYTKIGVIGFSLGAAVAIITASRERMIDSVITVAAPCDFWKINYHFWEPEMLEDLKLNLGPKGKGKYIIPGNPFRKKIKPISVVQNIAPTPLLLMHGENDWLIKPLHSKKLFEKAQEPKKCVIVLGAGHAERIFDAKPEEFMRMCFEWFDEMLVRCNHPSEQKKDRK